MIKLLNWDKTSLKNFQVVYGTITVLCSTRKAFSNTNRYYNQYSPSWQAPKELRRNPAIKIQHVGNYSCVINMTEMSKFKWTLYVLSMCHRILENPISILDCKYWKIIPTRAFTTPHLDVLKTPSVEPSIRKCSHKKWRESHFWEERLFRFLCHR